MSWFKKYEDMHRDDLISACKHLYKEGESTRKKVKELHEEKTQVLDFMLSNYPQAHRDWCYLEQEKEA